MRKYTNINVQIYMKLHNKLEIIHLIINADYL